MLSHVHPWTGAADGGNFGSTHRAPLAERPWASVGGRSGTVSVHLREQGRPQGASFSAGDLSLRSRSAQRFPGIVVYPVLQISGARRQRQRLGWRMIASRLDTLDKFSDEHENLGSPCSAGRASCRSTARGALSCRPSWRSMPRSATRSRLSGVGANVPAVGAGALCRARGRFARARAPAEHPHPGAFASARGAP